MEVEEGRVSEGGSEGITDTGLSSSRISPRGALAGCWEPKLGLNVQDMSLV